jgi:hypothetical protein
VQDASVEGDARTITVDVQFDPNVTNAQIIAAVAKRALEKDAADHAMIKVVFEKDQG